MRFRILGASIVILAALAAMEHLEPTPARFLVASDTVVSNGSTPFWLRVVAVNRRGDTLSTRGRHYVTSAGGVVDIAPNGAARCLRQGEASVTVEQDGAAMRLLVRCLPIRAFGFPNLWRLELGQDPILPSIVAYDSSGARITEFAGTATIRDSGVVRYRKGMLYPVAIGGTYLDMDFGGISNHQPIQVVQRVVDERLNLVAGEMRTWPLPIGRSELVLTVDSADVAARRVQLRVYSANCARGRQRRGEQHWFCISTAASRAVVSDARAVGSRGGARGAFRVWGLK